MIQQLSVFAGITLAALFPSSKTPTTEVTICIEEEDECNHSMQFSLAAQTASTIGEPISTIELTDTRKLDSEPVSVTKKATVEKPQVASVATVAALPKATPVPQLQEPHHAHPLDAQKLFDLVNQHRVSIGLQSFSKESNLCSIAESRAPELADEIFGSKPMHAGFKARNFEYWITENMIHQPTEEAALNWWLRSAVHRRAIESTNHTFSCTACSGNNCAMLFTSFIPKAPIE